MAEISREEVQAELRAVRAENDARFTQVLSSVDGLTKHFDAELTKFHAARESLPTKYGMLWTTVVSVASGVAATVTIMLGVLAIAGDRFDGGIGAATVSVEQAVEARRISRENAEQVERLNSKMDTLLDVLRGRVEE
ncbi:MAG: hypothetical protein ACMVY4_19230 [Minwuia sp.]|uniref:hypothetical protein n=1 Tax=Minwuia sp. TaxID=2493630 RepID=UPI003A843D15